MESWEEAMRMANVSEAHLHLIEGVCLCGSERKHNFRQIPGDVLEGALSVFYFLYALGVILSKIHQGKGYYTTISNLLVDYK